MVLWLSLHSGDYSTWNQIHRPKLNSEKKFHELREFLKVFNKIAPGSVTLHNVICRLNYHNPESILAFALETGSKEISFGQLSKFDEIQITKEEEQLLINNLKNLNSEFTKYKIKTNIHHFITARSFLKKETPSAEEKSSSKEKDETDLKIKTKFYDENDCYISWLFSPVDDCGNVRSCGPGRFLGSTKKKTYQE
ncbi:MAG: hypothetical protein EBX37_17150, partial [Alphaproteobacteria bacterium]|nr:hypothetical protein [Alphaproteobacteria bacterium]